MEHYDTGDDHAADQDVLVTLGPPLDQPHDGVGHSKDRRNVLE